MSDPHDQPLPEPSTPLWLPALGAALFSLAGIGWAVCPGDAPPPPAVEVAPAPTVAAAPAATPAPTPATPRPAHVAAPAGSGSAGVRAVHRPVLHPPPKH